MDLTVALDARYSVTPDGSVWSKIGMARSFWQRYLDVFDNVTIVARGTPIAEAPQGWLRVDGDGVVFHGIPDYHGPWECFKRYLKVRESIRSAVPARGAVILRVSSQISNMLENELCHRKLPFAVEVIGDPYEVFAPGVVDHRLRRGFRWHFSRRLRQQCLRALGAAYVTRYALQARYPCHSPFSVSDVSLPETAFSSGASTYYSNVEIRKDDISDSAYNPKPQGPYELVTVGSLEQLYKGTDVLIDAIARCVRCGVDLTATIVGGGKYQAALMAQTVRLGMESRIRFAGWVAAGVEVQKILDAADLFVLPSRTEGLPRALVEAMARARPCIGSSVGGIPELLDAPELVPAGDSAALADKILEVLQDKKRMEAMSLRNLKVSQTYSDAILGVRRRQFYQYVRAFTEEWEKKQ